MDFTFKCTFACMSLLLISISFSSSAIMPTSIPVRPTSSSRISNEIIVIPSSNKSNSIFSVIFQRVEETANRFIHGTQDYISLIKEVERIKKFKSKYGEQALSYTDYKLIEQSKDDFGKLFRVGITIPISPQIFFYSYLLAPMMSSASPWAWKSFPSPYDKKEKDIQSRYDIIKTRRVNSLFKIIHTIQKEAVEDGSIEIQQLRQSQIEELKQCLTQANIHRNLEAALNSVQSWLHSSVPIKQYQKQQQQQLSASKSNSNSKSSSKTNSNSNSNSNDNSLKLSLRLDKLPNSVLGDCVRALGSDGLPDFPVVKRFNVNELSRYCDKLREGDRFLSLIGVNKMTAPELADACYERCIAHENRDDKSLRSELNEWLRLSLQPSFRVVDETAIITSNGRNDNKMVTIENEQNRRLMLLGLNIARSVASSKDCQLYRLLVAGK